MGNFVIANTHLLLSTKPVTFSKSIVKEDITGVLSSKNNFFLQPTKLTAYIWFSVKV